MNKVNLVPAIRELQKIINEMKRDYETKVQPYRDSLNQLRKINTACELCNGTGKILRSRACAEDDRPDPKDPRDYKPCPYCAGTGIMGETLKERISNDL